jgi:two-component system phosphate regulon response regulator PhoB
MDRKRILIVEDDHSLAEIVAYNIGQAGYEVTVARDGAEGLRLAESLTPDVVILDLMLPVMDGMEVCRRIRSNAETANLLVLMLTAKSEEADEVIGFSVGADDYVTKPFSVKVLLERIKALLRRREATTSDHSEMVSCQGITVDLRRHRVSIDDVELDLTPSEFRLLETMIRQPGRAFTRDQLIDSALGENTIVLERTIDVHIRSLRKKLAGNSSVIETVRGVGYRFRDRSGKNELVGV